MLNALETYSVLSESKIEGIETISNRFQHMYSALKKKPYDPLDHRKPDFEADFSEFKRQVTDFEVRVNDFHCFRATKGKQEWRSGENTRLPPMFDSGPVPYVG